jgi:hypothetical protein
LEQAKKVTGTITDERRAHERFHLLTRVDIVGAGGDTYWASLKTVSRRRVALSVHQNLKPGQKVMIRFCFRIEDEREQTEHLPAKVIWRSGDNTGLEFETPLITASPALQKTPYLAAHLMLKEAGR